ncbi:MAG TPA: SUMF1/EgtB/PvdO family nonheme iron enzyme [Ramlibacter sp.]|nr:SUMF1/EgtB/PvdO family nonheme iron enzyme [Ramlibacter sp.]
MTGKELTAGIDSPAMRSAGKELLSLALIDARNHTLQLLGRYEAAMQSGLQLAPSAELEPPAWIAGHAGWLAERWLARNPARASGAQADGGVVLASIEPMADAWFAPQQSSSAERWRAGQPSVQLVRDYLLATLEQTLDLLALASETDDALRLFRAALFHEDACGEQLVTMAQTAGVPLALTPPAPQAARDALLAPATRWTLGHQGPGFSLALERPAHPVDVPEFEIDAQPVTWAQFVEFVDDGGYDRVELWQSEGWAWLQAHPDGRRGPRHVEQIGVASGAVMQAWFGKALRRSGSQSAMHLSWWEADAWARWAGRRLPTEVEWEAAASTASSRGFRWGDALEWTAATLRPWEGYAPDLWATDTLFDPQAFYGRAKVVRGASFATRARMKHPVARRFALPGRDDAFIGFRTCAV